jgi:hypothetical protein
MKHNEVRQFLKEANAVGLSPIEKDVFQYYFSRTNGGEWYCPDSETAEEICRSRNGVSEARKNLIKRGWITENGQFNISILKNFSVGNPTQTDESQSEIRLNGANLSRISDSPVGNPTQTDDFSVGNPTLYKDKRNIGIEEKLEEKTHTERVRVREKFSDSRNGIFIHETEAQEITNKILTGIRTRTGLQILPHEHTFAELSQWAFVNKITAERVLLCYDTLEKQRKHPVHWRKGRTTAKTVMENLPDLTDLIAETEQLINGAKNGIIRTNNQNGFESNLDKRNREASERIRAGHELDDVLRAAGII